VSYFFVGFRALQQRRGRRRSRLWYVGEVGRRRDADISVGEDVGGQAVGVA